MGEFPSVEHQFTADSVECRQLMSKGGQVVSQEKKDAQRLRRIKEHLRECQMTDKEQGWLLDMLEHKPSMGVDILETVNEIKKMKKFLSAKDLATLGNLQVSAMKAIHGEKLSVDMTSKSIVMNIHMSIDTYPELKMKEGVIDNDTDTIPEDN